MALIERARQKIIEQESASNSYKEIFDTALSLLSEKGKPTRFYAWKYQNLEHTVNSTEPHVKISFLSGIKTDKANNIRIYIEGLNGFSVSKKKSSGQNNFNARYVLGRNLNFAEAQDLLTTIKKVQQALQEDLSQPN